MDKITFIEIESHEITETYAIIEHADGSFTSMTKAEYDQQQAALSTPSV